jgi:RNA polymerase sigma factor (sigma-70 family)
VPLISVPDAGLVALCRAGEQAAWRELVRRYSPYVFSILVRAYGIPEQQARDVFQEVFLRCWERLDSLRDEAALRPWLGQVTRNLAREHLRRVGRQEGRERPLGDVENAEVESALDEIDEAVAVREEMAHLPDDCREILERFYVEDEGYRAIAAALGLTTGALAGRKARCLDLLRGRLERTNRGGDPSGKV